MPAVRMSALQTYRASEVDVPQKEYHLCPILMRSEDVLRTVPQDEEVMTESTAIKATPPASPPRPANSTIPRPAARRCACGSGRGRCERTG
jgi:hypothetical protein